jgi:LEA14-like dessication related protein
MKKPLLILFLLVPFLGAMDCLEETAAALKCEYALENGSLKTFTVIPPSITFTLTIAVSNPDPSTDARLNKMDFTLYVDNKWAAEASNPLTVVVPATQRTTFPLDVTSTASTIYGMLTAIQNGTVVYKITGTVYYEVLGKEYSQEITLTEGAESL